MSTCCTCGNSWPTGTDGSHSCSQQLLKRKMYNFEEGYDDTYTVIATSEQEAIDLIAKSIKEEHAKAVKVGNPIALHKDGTPSQAYNLRYFEGKTPETCTFKCTVYEAGEVYIGEVC